MQERPLFLFAPGAGASSHSSWMQEWSERLRTLGEVVLFDYPYVLQGRKVPDPLARLVAAHRDALEGAFANHLGPVVLVGKSMGSRIGCHVALTDPRVRALICFGYPLRGASGALRDGVLLELRTPILFLQGTRDALCPLETLAEVRPRMQARTRLCTVEGGDHSLAVGVRERQRQGTTTEELAGRILSEIREFCATEGLLPVLGRRAFAGEILPG